MKNPKSLMTGEDWLKIFKYYLPPPITKHTDDPGEACENRGYNLMRTKALEAAEKASKL